MAEPPVTKRAGAGDLAIALALGTAALAIYVLTLQPSVPGGDSGELIAVAARLGVAHPPGYPLFTLLGKAFSLIPIGSVAWRVNLLSAVMDAACAGLMSLIVAELTGSRWAGFAAGGMFAFAPLVWTYAVAAEVFPLNNLCVAALLYAALRWSLSREPRWAYAACAVIGVGMTNHHTLVFYALPVLVWMLATGAGTLLSVRRILVMAACLAAPLLLYLELPLAAWASPPILWGDPTSFTGLVHHLLRRDYGTLRLGGDLPAGRFFFQQIASYGRSLAANTLGIGWIVAGVGLVGSLRLDAVRRWMRRWRPDAKGTDDASGRSAGDQRKRRAVQVKGAKTPVAPGGGQGMDGIDPGRIRAYGGLLLVCWLFYLLVFHLAANLPVNDPLFRDVTSRFWQQADIIVFIWFGAGLASLATSRRWLAPAICLLLVAAQVGLHAAGQNERGNRIVEQYGRAILEPLPPSAILLTKGDLVTNSVRYLQLCESVRPDVAVLDQEMMTKSWYVAAETGKHPDIVFPGTIYLPGREGGFTMKAFLDANVSRRPIGVYPELKPGDASPSGTFELWPLGMAFRVVSSANPPELTAWVTQEERSVEAAERRTAWPAWSRYGAGRWERVVLEDLWQARHRQGVWLLNQAIRRGDDPALLADARRILETALRSRPDPPAFIDKNLGIVYERLASRGDPGLLELRDAVWREYLRTGPADDPDRAAIAAALEARRR